MSACTELRPCRWAQKQRHHCFQHDSTPMPLFALISNGHRRDGQNIFDLSFHFVGCAAGRSILLMTE